MRPPTRSLLAEPAALAPALLDVAVDDVGHPVPIPEITPQTDLEKERYNAALRRKQLSLVLAGKMKAKDATELKALFE